MVDKSTEVKVGIAVSVGILIFVFTVFMLGQDSSLFATTYRLHAAFKKIDGLGAGSVVRMDGLRIGNVEKLDFQKDMGKPEVTLKIENKYKSIITKGSIAGLRTQGALGDKYVSVEPAAPTKAPLENGDWLEVEESGDLLSMLSNRGNEIEKIFDILNEFSTFAKNLNYENRTGRILDNLASSTSNLSAFLKDLKGEDSESLRKALRHIASITEKIDNGDGTLGALINDPSIHEKIKAILGTSQRNLYMKSAIQKTIQQGEK